MPVHSVGSTSIRIWCKTKEANKYVLIAINRDESDIRVITEQIAKELLGYGALGKIELCSPGNGSETAEIKNASLIQQDDRILFIPQELPATRVNPMEASTLKRLMPFRMREEIAVQEYDNRRTKRAKVVHTGSLQDDQSRSLLIKESKIPLGSQPERVSSSPHSIVISVSNPFQTYLQNVTERASVNIHNLSKRRVPEMEAKWNKANHGHCNVPHSYNVEGINLGNWTNSQQHHSTQKEILETFRIQQWEKHPVNLLNQWERMLNFSGLKEEGGHCNVGYGKKNEAKWNDKFEVLRKFKAKYGHCNVRRIHKFEGTNLGSWVTAQRRLKRKENLETSRIQRLDSIGFEWERKQNIMRDFDGEWERNFNLLRRFKEKEGHCNVTYSCKIEGTNLGCWVAYQRSRKKQSKLKAHQFQRLEDIGFEWKLKNRNGWEMCFNLLCKFKQEKGHCNVPQCCVFEGIRLGNWVHAQRTRKRQEILETGRIQRLEDVGFKWEA